MLLTSAESTVEETGIIDDKHLDNQTSGGHREISEKKRTSHLPVFAGLLLVATVAGYLFTNQLSTNNCIISTSNIDSTHWQAVVRGGDLLSGNGCDESAQMPLTADEKKPTLATSRPALAA